MRPPPKGYRDTAATGQTGFKQLADHLNKAHHITILGAGHLSTYMGAGAVKGRLIEPKDFALKRL